MKMKFIPIVCLLLCVFLSSCDGKTSTEQTQDTTVNTTITTGVTDTNNTATTTDSKTDVGNTSTVNISTSGTVNVELPTYTSGTITLQPREDSEQFDFLRSHRLCYYSVSGVFFDLVEDDSVVTAFLGTKVGDNTHELDEMLLVSFIKHFNITREQFDQTIEKKKQLDKQIATLTGNIVDYSHESTELPNGDIIYTFDNEIINKYYRYE